LLVLYHLDKQPEMTGWSAHLDREAGYRATTVWAWR
jgi:hypothetical protein